MSHLPRSLIARRGSRRQPELSRHAILQAALVEFAQEGLAGARMDAIADAAAVNKALLYYYFRDKDTLYGAVLDGFFEPLHQRILAVCDQPGTAGARFLSYARVHFDSIAASPHYARIFMGELMSASRGGATHLDRLAEKYMMPIGLRVLALIQEGVHSGEFRPVDPAQFIPSAIGSIVHYFLTAPLRKKFAHAAPFSEQSIDARRAAVLDFIAAALFADRDAGTALAAQIAQDEELLDEHRLQQPPSGDIGPAPGRRVVVEGRESSSPPSPMPAPDAANLPKPKGGYTWINRWFPDVETARKVLEEEAKRYPRSAKAKRRPKPSGRGGSQ